MDKKEQSKEQGVFNKFLALVERAGNRIPHPAMLFLILCGLVIVVSGIGAKLGWSAPYYDAKAGEEVIAKVNSLFNAEGVRYIFNSAVTNFTSFAPLGTVLVAIIGVGVAEYSGLINTSLKKTLMGVDPKWLTAIVVFTGIMSNIADASGYVVVIPLGAMMFAAVGRHPIAGLAAAFAGVSGGFSANLLISPNDAVLAGITNEALNSVGMNYEIASTSNWYFLIASTVLLVVLGTFITDKIIEPRLGVYKGDYKPDDEPITELENKGLRNAGIGLLVVLIIMGFLMFGDNAILKSIDSDGNLTLTEFLNNGLLLMILLVFTVPGFVYGKTVGTMEGANDLVKGMASGTKSMSTYLVLVFFASQFVSYFGHTNLGIIVSVKGAELLQSINFVGFPLIVAFVIVASIINIFIGSASAKWGIMAPMFVPMMMKLGLSPELTQMAYRIGDSSTNIITPLMSYFAMIVAFAQRYDKESGLGTLISNMLPYSFLFLIGWIVLLGVWFLLGLPLGPGASILV